MDSLRTLSLMLVRFIWAASLIFCLRFQMNHLFVRFCHLFGETVSHTYVGFLFLYAAFVVLACVMQQLKHYFVGPNASS